MIGRLSVGARLAGGFAVLMALVLVQSALSRGYLATLNGRVEQIYSREVVAIKEIAQAKSDLYSLRLDYLSVAVETDAGALQALLERTDQAKARLANWARRYRAAAVGPVEEKLAARFAGHFKIFAHHLEGALRLSGRGPGALSAEGEHAYAKAQALLNDIVRFNDHSAHTRQLYAAADYQTASKIVISLGALFFVLGCIIAVVITKSVTRPLREMVHMADRVAAGDLTVSARAGGPDELGRVLDAMRNMTAQLGALVRKVRDCSGSIAESADWLKTSSTEAASKTEQQASALEETATSIEELTATVKQNAEHSAEATRLIAASIAATRETASSGATVMDAVAENMQLTYAAAQKIAGISNVIGDIAFQTNVLSLNATIEAARAGERGRGFAVVAAEVRNLAARSAAAASDVTRLINDSLSKASAGKGLVAQAVGRMNEVVQQVAQASSVLENIALVSAEQSQGITQINDAINEIDRITQDNLRSVEDTAAAAGTLAENASSLEAAVGSFKLKHAVSNPAPEPAPRVVDYHALGGLQGAA